MHFGKESQSRILLPLFKEAEVKGEGEKSQEWNRQENPKQIKCKPRVTSNTQGLDWLWMRRQVYDEINDPLSTF